jgi:hypothetical protein
MVGFALMLKARLEGVQEIQMSAEARWYFQLRCQICGEPHPNEIYVTLDSAVGGRRQKTDKTFVMSCKFCHNECSLNYIPGSIVPYRNVYEEFQTVAQFEARGLTIVHWTLPQDLKIVTQAGTSFTEQRLEGQDWTEYDEDAGEPVAIYGVETRVERC